MSPITDWLTSIGTVGAVIVAVVLALWGGQIRQFGARARFKVLFERKRPDCQLVNAPIAKTFSTTFVNPQAIIRFRVDKSGITAATNVEVRMLQLWQATSSGVFEPDPDFLPVNLTWTNIEATTTRVLHPGLPRHCEFIRMFSPDREGEAVTFYFQTDSERADLGTGVNPYVKGEGRYRIEIGISADNMRPLRKTFEVSFTGAWSDDVDRLFGTELAVTLL